MKRFGLMIVSFLVTFVLLISVWMVGTGRSPFSGLAPAPSPAPTQQPTAPPASPLPPTASPSPTASAIPSATPSVTGAPVTPSPSPAPLRTPPASIAPPSSSQPGGNSESYTMTGAEYTTYQMPEDASLLLNGESLVLRTTEDSSDALWVTYTLDPSRLPAGAIVHSVSVAVCGYGSGQFWEVYGPTGADPHEYEVVPPEADGCWHFRDVQTADLSTIAATMLESTMVIDRVVFTVTFGA